MTMTNKTPQVMTLVIIGGLLILFINLFILDIRDTAEATAKVDQLESKLNNCQQSLIKTNKVLDNKGLNI